MLQAGVTRDKIRHSFGSLQNLQEIAVKLHPNHFEGLISEHMISDADVSRLRSEIRKYKTFVITTAIGGGTVNGAFLENIRKYCKENNAKALFLMCEDPASVNKFRVPAGLEGETFIFADIELNSNLFISTIKLSAKHIDPVTGLSRIGQRDGSFIYASPKQRLVFAPTRNNKLPHALMTTGAITLPDYTTDKYLSERTAYIAHHDHVMGAIIIEIQDEQVYHFRQIQADSDGDFVDLGNHYRDGSIKKMRPAAFVLGDWHSGETDSTAKKAWKEVIEATKPELIVLHDAFNGKSINHHEKHKKVKRAMLYSQGRLSLVDELRQFAADLNEIATWADKVVIVKSNHDAFLQEILEDGRFINDPINFNICAKLASAMMEGHDPLTHGAEMYGLTAKNIVWLARDEDYIVAEIELGAHGDKGPNGSRGNIKNLETSYGDCVIGHSHTPGILRGSWQVGTSSFLDLDYKEGTSSWVHSSCLVYPNKQRQLINVIFGNWRL